MRRGLLRLGHGRTRSGFVRARDDPTTFADVYLQYSDNVLRYFARRTFDPETAFDLMAETFAELFAHIDDFRGDSEEQGRAWMWTVARHQLYRWRERGVVERRSLERLDVPVATLGPAEYERIEELADLQRLRPLLDRALDELGDDQRSALRARIVDHRAYDEIASEAGVTAQVVRARVSRGLRRAGPDHGRERRGGDADREARRVKAAGCGERVPSRRHALLRLTHGPRPPRPRPRGLGAGQGRGAGPRGPRPGARRPRAAGAGRRGGGGARRARRRRRARPAALARPGPRDRRRAAARPADAGGPPRRGAGRRAGAGDGAGGRRVAVRVPAPEPAGAARLARRRRRLRLRPEPPQEHHPAGRALRRQRLDRRRGARARAGRAAAARCASGARRTGSSAAS